MREARKIQKAGYSSLSISLPRGWVRERGLKSGDLLMVAEDAEGFLKISTPSERRHSTRCIINADECQGERLLERVIVGCYLLGYDGMRIVAGDELTHLQLVEIKDITKRLPGLEMVEQTLRRVVLRCFVDPTRVPVDELLKRVHAMITTMLNEAVDSIKGKRPELAREVIQMKEEVQEISFLLVRQILLSLGDRELAGEVGIDSPVSAAGKRIIAKVLEEMANLIAGVAESTMKLNEGGNKLPDETSKEIQEFAESVQIIFGKTMKALFGNEVAMANGILSRLGKVREERRVLEELLAGRDAEITAVRSILLNLGMIADYCATIAETTIYSKLRESTNLCTIEKGQGSL